ncbi:MAG TPA: type VI secretion system protein TssA [Polyangium sp.]|nr:type VI secretion system protein TssA [Polyangium sp.]
MTTKIAPPDLEALLEPISAESPCGLSLRYDGTYDRVREARREDDASLPMGDWETNLKVADWSLVEKLCREALSKKSKDLQIAAWLAEAWLRKNRLQGLTWGLSLFAQLTERFYTAGLFPLLIDDEDPTARVALVEWIDDVFTDRVRTTTLGAGGEGQGFSLLDWESAGQTSASSGSDGDSGPRPTRESLLAKFTLGGGTRWTDIADEAAGGIAAAESVEQAFGVHVERPPTLRRLRDVLASIERLARDAARTSGEVATNPANPASFGGVGGDVMMFNATVGGGSTGPITSRADAYYRLAEAAEYLMRTEPHSPVPYLVKRAVQWGNMSLAQLLYEFVGNPEDLVAIQRLLGMRGRDES